jgi:transcriptional regulator GlxA family with amidase domain
MLRIGYILEPGFQVMAFGALSVFELANLLPDGPRYDVRLLSESGGRVRSSLGTTVETEPFGSRRFDTVIVGGSISPVAGTAALRKFLRRSLRTSRRIASVCTGAFALAGAGILDGRRATTHWAYARDFKAQFPQVELDADRIFVNDGPIWTSAGMSAGIDLALGLVEGDLGAESARTIARKLVVYHRRAGGQSQHSVLLELDAKTDRIQNALAYARSHLHASLSVEELADAAHLSPRQFSRAFRAETGQSPAKAVEQLRVEAARLLLEQSSLPVEVVANETGFADRERMRRAFLRAFGQPPQAMRRGAHAAPIRNSSPAIAQ